MTRRLERLFELVERFERRGGDTVLAYEPRSRRHPDEIDRLGLTFDRMAARIAWQIEQFASRTPCGDAWWRPYRTTCVRR
ncbi:MAG: hypothetical protein U5L11_01090 [Arhodomonas sp.]|nr:hypothetical protein [Arhodomonas sp.]